MTFANIDGLLILGMLVLGTTLWMLVKPAPAAKPARIAKNPDHPR